MKYTVRKANTDFSGFIIVSESEDIVARLSNNDYESDEDCEAMANKIASALNNLTT